MTAMTLEEIRPPQPCAECGRPTDLGLPSTMFEVTGWAAKRKRGLHSLSFKHETGRVMCGRCAAIKKETGIATQGRLL